MYLNIRMTKLLWPLVLLLPILLSFSNFLIDCVLDFRTSIDNIIYLWGYFIYYLFFRLWAFLPAIFLYLIIFSRRKQYSLIYKVAFIILTSVLFSLVFFTNDLNIFHHPYTDIKRTATYFISLLTLMFLYEYLKGKNYNPS